MGRKEDEDRDPERNERAEEDNENDKADSVEETLNFAHDGYNDAAGQE